MKTFLIGLNLFTLSLAYGLLTGVAEYSYEAGSVNEADFRSKCLWAQADFPTKFRTLDNKIEECVEKKHETSSLTWQVKFSSRNAVFEVIKGF